MIKKIIRLLVVSVLFIGFFSEGIVFGKLSEKQEPNTVSGALIDDPYLGPEVDLKLQEETAKKDERVKKLMEELAKKKGKQSQVEADCIIPDNTYGKITIWVANYKQERTYWCGPACVKQSLSFHKRVSGSSYSLPSQATLAEKIGTTTSGSLTTKIADALNSYSGKFGYIYYLASDIAYCENPLVVFRSRIVSMIYYKETAPIVLLQTRYLHRYKSEGKYIRHYVTISGYDDSSNPVKMRTVDPNYDDRFLGIWWDPVGCTEADGVFRAVYNADLEGTNKVMAW